MKLRLKLYILLGALGMATACQRDFDELNDTDQRHIEFAFNTDSLFVNTLCNDNGAYSFPHIDALPEGYRLRITVYCYDESGDLLCSDKIFTGLHSDQTIKIRHLTKKTTYQFVFVADVVRYESPVDYYETWYQINTQLWRLFYLYADNRHDNPVYDVLGSSTMTLQPENQTVTVNFTSITYNGYYIFTQLHAVDHLTGFFAPCVSFGLRTLRWKETSSIPYMLDYRNPEEDIILPVSLCYADSILYLQVISNTLSRIDTSDIRIHNPQRRPFVATIDCQSSQLSDCTFY